MTLVNMTKGSGPLANLTGHTDGDHLRLQLGGAKKPGTPVEAPPTDAFISLDVFEVIGAKGPCALQG